MKILFVGDIIGKPGREVLARVLRSVQEENRIDFTVANAENASGGAGLTPAVAEEILGFGVDVLTTGNHVFRHTEILVYLERQPRILRPLNFPRDVPGNGEWLGESASGAALWIANFQGRVFMDPVDCPFRSADAAIARLGDTVKTRLVDFHAEASSEKGAFGWHLDGRVSAVLGTHTHVQTADERVLPGGTAYITDAGMTGSIDSVIGVEIEAAVGRFLTGLPHRFKPAKNNPVVCGAIIDVDEATGKARSIERLRVPPRDAGPG